MSRLAVTIVTGIAPGSRWRYINRHQPTPPTRAASICGEARSLRTSARTMRVYSGHQTIATPIRVWV